MAANDKTTTQVKELIVSLFSPSLLIHKSRWLRTSDQSVCLENPCICREETREIATQTSQLAVCETQCSPTTSIQSIQHIILCARIRICAEWLSLPDLHTFNSRTDLTKLEPCYVSSAL